MHNIDIDNVNKINVEVTNSNEIDINAEVDVNNINIQIKDVAYIAPNGNNEKLANKPKINTVELTGNKTFEELGLEECLNQDIEYMFK